MKKTPIHASILLETLLSLSILVLLAVGLYSIISGGMALFASNSAANPGRQEVFNGMDLLQQELRAAVSSPQLMDSAGAAVGGTGPAAGVSFGLFAAGPFLVQGSPESCVNVISEKSTRIVVAIGVNEPVADFRPQVGQSLHIQLNPVVEREIVAVTALGSENGKTLYDLTLKEKLGSRILLRDGAGNQPVSCFFTTPVKYSIQFDAENRTRRLVRTGLNSSGGLTSETITRNINASSAMPFSVPSFNGAPNYGYIAVGNLTDADHALSKHKFPGAQMAASLLIPHFGQPNHGL